MALELESEIMRRIGLGNHFSWFNGSESCGGIRTKAACMLTEEIAKAHKEVLEIARPVAEHIELARIMSAEEGIDTILTKTWQVCSEVIAAHIHLYHIKDQVERDEFIKSMIVSIQKVYRISDEPIPIIVDPILGLVYHRKYHRRGMEN